MTLHGIRNTKQEEGTRSTETATDMCVGDRRGEMGIARTWPLGGNGRHIISAYEVKMPASANKLATSSSPSDSAGDSSISPTRLLYANSFPPQLKACKQQLLGGWGSGWCSLNGRLCSGIKTTSPPMLLKRTEIVH